MDRSLWEFSLALYAAPGVAARCLELQDRSGADVNLLLCTAWIGASGRGRLDVRRLAALDAAVRPLRDNVVRPLRAARIWLRAPAATNVELATLRTEIKRLELAAEKTEQAKLETLSHGERSVVGAELCLADAVSNVALYLAQLGGPDVAIGDAVERALRVALLVELAGDA